MEGRDGLLPARPASGVQRLLLIALDNRRRAHLRAVRVLAELAQGATLSEQVPTLIQFDLDRLEADLLAVVERSLLIEPLFLLNEILDVIDNAGITCFRGHRSPYSWSVRAADSRFAGSLPPISSRRLRETSFGAACIVTSRTPLTNVALALSAIAPSGNGTVR